MAVPPACLDFRSAEAGLTAMAVTATAIPAHVPAQLVWDHDINVFPALFADPYAGACEAIHAGPDIVWCTSAYNGRPGWLMTRFALIEEVHLDPARFAAGLSRDITVLLGHEVPLLPSESDPPEHRIYRQFIQPWFQPSFVAGLDARIREICRDLIAGFEARGSCEFVAEFSSLFPSSVFLALMGLPRELLLQFLAWEHDFLRGDSFETRARAAREIHDYFAGLIDERRRHPEGDMVSMIANGAIEGRRLSDDEARGMCIMLYIGGLDSVTSGLGWYMRHLALDPVLQAALRDAPALIPDAIEEFVRAYGTNSTMRTVTGDIAFHGVAMKRGDIVVLPTFFASRDPRQYRDPHRFDIARKARTMTFATGAHNCAGIHLAKREIRIVLEEFLARLPNIRIPAGDAAVLTTQTIWGVKRLPLEWDRERDRGIGETR